MILNNSSSCFVGIVLLGSLYLVFAPGGVIKLTKFALLLKLTYRVTINFQSTSLCLREYVNEQYFDDTINLQKITMVYHLNISSRNTVWFFAYLVYFVAHKMWNIHTSKWRVNTLKFKLYHRVLKSCINYRLSVTIYSSNYTLKHN